MGESMPDLRSWLTAIGTLASAVNAEDDLTSLLNLVAATAKDLLDLSFCAVMLPDPQEKFMMVAGSSGLTDDYIARLNRDGPIRLEDGPLERAPATVQAFRTGKPCTVKDDAVSPTESSWVAIAREYDYRSVLAVPLLTSAGVIGTLNSFRSTPHEFTAHEVEQLELLAEHAAIALTSARILDDIRDKHALIVRSEAIHNRLLDVAVRSGGVSGIATALHDLLGCDVAIQDMYGATLAADPQEPVACPPSDETAALSAGNPTNPPGMVRDVGPHVATDVLLDGTTVATVWLLDRAGSLDALSVRAVEHASVVLSLELLRQRTAAEVEQTLRGELLADLLAGADTASATIQDRAGLMGHNLGLPHRMLVAAARSTSSAPEGGHTIVDDGDLAQRAATEAVRLTRHLKPCPLIAAVRGFVVALWPDGQEAANGGRTLRRAFTAADSGTSVTVAVSSVATDGIPAAYRCAKGALAFAAADGQHNAEVSLEDMGAAGLLLQYADPEELRRYALRTIGVLRKYDTDHDAELLKTLRTYLDSDLDRRSTAELLFLHPNTVSQRLRRVETLTGLDLRSPRSVIEARTELLLTDVADAATDGRS